MKMKLSLILSLLISGYITTAIPTQSVLSDVDNVEASFGPNHFGIYFTDPDSVKAAEDFISELNALEEIDGRSLIADLIQNILEGFRDTVINGNENIPVLDPLHIPYVGPYEFNTTGIRASVGVENFRMEGLRWYVVDYVSFNAFRLTLGLQVTVPWLTVTGKYDAQARLALVVTHKAQGDFRVFINRLVVGVDITLGTNLFGGGHLILRDLDIKIDIFDTQIQITGMTGSNVINSFINSLIQNITQDVIQNQLQNVSEALSRELFDVINEVLKDYTINDILG